MADIADYADLLVASGEYAGRNDFAHLFSRFVGMAETKINRLLRVADMEATDTVSVSDGIGDLPADYLEARDVRFPNGRAIFAQSLTWLKNHQNVGCPLGYAVVGKKIHVGSNWAGSLDLTYYQKIPSLTPANPSNWLLSRAATIYLFGVVEQVAAWAGDRDRVLAADQLMMADISSLKVDDSVARFGNGLVIVQGATP